MMKSSCSHRADSLVETEKRQPKTRASIGHTDLRHGDETVAISTLQSRISGLCFNEVQTALNSYKSYNKQVNHMH